MAIKSGLLFLTLLVGSLALPHAPETEDMSQFFVHADPEARIVGGTPAAEGSVPYMVALSDGLIIRNFFCGGSVISANSVLTAAHCIEAVYTAWSGLSRNVRMTVGTNRHNSGGTAYSAARNITHPHYLRSTIKNDIGLLITSTPIAFNNRVQPVPLSFDSVPGNVPSRAAGWGRIGQNRPISTTLLELEVRTVDAQQCPQDMNAAAAAQGFRAPVIEPHIELCIYHSPGYGMCNGDSGSALVRIDSQEQIGVVSWGLPCARGAPDVFARISGFTDWLKANIV